MVQILAPKYRQNPNAPVHSAYTGVSNNGRTVTAITRVAPDGNHLMTERVEGPSLPRGAGGHVGTLVLGGLVTSRAEMEDIMQYRAAQQFKPRRKNGEIAKAIYQGLALRNQAIEDARRYYKGNPSEMPKRKKKVRLYLPVGYRFVPTGVPGLSLRQKVG